MSSESERRNAGPQSPASTHSFARLVVLYLAGIASIVFVFLAVLSFLHGSSASPVRDLANLAALPFIFGILPAMALALIGRMLPLAVLLIVSAVLFSLYAFANLQ